MARIPNDIRRAKDLKLRTERKAKGVCTQCGRSPAMPGLTLCKEHNDKSNKRSREWFRDHPGKTYQVHIRLKYGLSLEEWNKILESQGGKCAICRSDKTGTRFGWCVDHNHETGEVRGILCNGCNVGLGGFKDDPLLLQRAARYLVIRGGKTTLRQAPLMSMEEQDA